jgi:spermidine synthase
MAEATAASAERPNARVRLGEDGDRLALLVEGVVQSVAVDARGLGPSYWTAMLPDVRPRDVLILGLGAGTIAHLLVNRFGPIPIVGVERDPEVLALARTHFGLDEHPSLTLVLQDAFEYVASCERRFGLVCVDLYDGLTLARGTTSKPFLRGVSRLLSPVGVAHFNLVLSRRLPRQLHRLAEFFDVLGTAEVDFNVVVRCRAR